MVRGGYYVFVVEDSNLCDGCLWESSVDGISQSEGGSGGGVVRGKEGEKCSAATTEPNAMRIRKEERCGLAVLGAN